MSAEPPPAKFTPYQIFVIAVLAFLQFTIVLDFVILSPLGAQLMPELGITPSQFGLVVSAYAFSAGVAGLLSAGFADRFDRKKLLLFFYSGFIAGTLLCALAPTYEMLLIARMVTGIFGGVIGSVVFAITTDLFSFQVRGRVMGVIQTAFAVTNVLGIPIGLSLSNRLGWHTPFFMIVAISAPVGILILMFLKPIDAHLSAQSDKSPLKHFSHILRQQHYIIAYIATALLTTGGFMMMPFGSAFNVNNLGVTLEQLPLIYLITGICSLFITPLAGRLSDSHGKFKVFAFGSLLSMTIILIYTHLQAAQLPFIIFLSVVMFIGISARIVSASALTSAVPVAQDRGAFMAVNSSIQQLSGGLASAFAGLIVVQTSSGRLEHYDTLGYVVTLAMFTTLLMMHRIDKQVRARVIAP